MATSGGLAGSTGRDFNGWFWQSARFHHASNNHINPRLKNPAWSKGIGVFGPFGLIQKIPPGQFWTFDIVPGRRYLTRCAGLAFHIVIKKNTRDHSQKTTFEYQDEFADFQASLIFMIFLCKMYDLYNNCDCYRFGPVVDWMVELLTRWLEVV